MSYIVPVALLTFLLAIGLKCFLKYWKRNKWLNDNFKGRKNPNFLFGDFIFVLGPYVTGKLNISQSNLQGILKLVDLYRDQKIIRMFSYFFMPWIIIADWSYAKECMNKQYLDKTIFTRFLVDSLGQGLLTVSGPAWAPKRKMLAHTFHVKFYDQFIPVMGEYSMDMVEQLNEVVANGDGIIDNIDKYISNLSMSVLLETIMGVDARSRRLLCKTYAKVSESLLSAAYERVYKPWAYLNCIYFRTPTGRKVKQLINFAKQFAYGVVEQRQKLVNFENNQPELSSEAENESFGKKRKPFLDFLLEQQHHNPKAFTKEDIVDEVNTFLAAGHHTVSIALTFVVYLLGLHPDAQEKVLKEVEDAFDGPRLRLDKIRDLKYTEAVTKESLRLYPPVPNIARAFTTDTKIGPYVIPKGVACAIPIMSIHRDPAHFDEPHLFKPERFLGNQSDELPQLAFGWGPRRCIGQKFALTELKIVLAYLCKHFTFESLTATDEITLGNTAALNTTPIQIRLTKRQ